MQVSSKEIRRYADQGTLFASAYFAGIPGMLGVMAVDKITGKITGNPEAGGDVKGTYYKVKKQNE